MLGLTGIYASQIASYKKRIDTDGQTFITAANLTTNAQKSYINTMVTSFKSAGLWTKFVAAYPMIGTSAAQTKLNLKNPVDTAAAFSLQYFVGWTHDISGLTPSAGAYADTRINVTTNLTNNNVHMALMAHSNGNFASSANAEFGTSVSGTSRLVLALRTSDLSLWDSYTNTVRASAANTSTEGVMGIGSRTSTTSSAYFRGYVSNNIITNISGISSSGGSIPNTTIFLNGLAAGSVVSADRTYTFASVGAGLTALEAGKLFKTVKSCQIILNRLGS